MLKFYFNGSPNPTKVALFLEEAGLPYEAIPVEPFVAPQNGCRDSRLRNLVPLAIFDLWLVSRKGPVRPTSSSPEYDTGLRCGSLTVSLGRPLVSLTASGSLVRSP
jgi:hypothetical protein